ncbi:phosphate ABC transporter permease subunit PstC [Hathewaya massiliensis]|uniref:phosphate ABC transporter permease subunit PstC n=1 Tax=Hathewaya massiliensis TaxID=1964382 RepID=UPI001159778D|nr:phosphate ABC transporter permease subunit PstC [Hathewaya massiliensis]
MEKRSYYNKLKTEYLGRGYAFFCGILIVVLTISIISFLAFKGLSTFINNNISIKEFIFSTKWMPESDTPSFGAGIFILGSTFVSLGAVLISAPISIALAIFMNFISLKLGKKIIQPTLELFVGIPSVVYGWIGITVLVPFIKKIFGGIGFSLLSGIIVLSIMILPTIASISSDALKAIPNDYIEASYGLGATRWQTISRVIIPAGKNEILTAIVLGLARAFGEALAVQMVIGNALKKPFYLLKPTTTLTSIITMDMANTVSGTAWNDALWSLALLLLIISFIFILLIKFLGKRGGA